MGLEQACQSAAAFLTAAAVVATGLAAVVWLGLAIPMLLGQRRVRGLGSAGTGAGAGPPAGDADRAGAAEWPAVTVITAARDEAARVEEAARSLLTLDYPRLQLVFVDDRSTDGTGAILDRLAASDPRLKVLHVGSIPDGWLGKCHALARGASVAKGAWLLFTDGDVWLEPGTLRRAMVLAEELGADHLAVSADLEIRSLGERIFIGYFSALFYASQKPWDAPDPRSRSHVGIGAFNLVRRDVYDRAGGHERLRMEVVDDMGLGLIVKEAGGRSWFAFHDGFLRVRWHQGVGGLIHGVEKNAFAALRYRAGETIVAVCFQFMGTWAPVFGWFLPGLWPKVFAAAGWAGLAALYYGVSRNLRIRWWDFLTAPIGACFFSYAILRSMFFTLRRRGVVWRDTHYGIESLRKGRVR
jgi:glycosyltransferase involved in cell wall biosynthesis